MLFNLAVLWALIELLPADLIPRYANLLPSYLQFSALSGVLTIFWHGGYDPAFATYDYNNRGTIATDEVVSILFAAVEAPSYTCSLYLVTGANDFIFCNPTSAPDGADCSPTGPGYLNETGSLYPAAEPFNWYAPLNSGHCWHFHYEAYNTFVNIHQWLAGQGF